MVLSATSATHSPTAAVLATRISDSFVRNLTLMSPIHHSATGIITDGGTPAGEPVIRKLTYSLTLLHWFNP